jgi:hypothetical protein
MATMQGKTVIITGAWRDERRDTMDVHTCVAQIVRALERRERELVMTARAKVGLFLKLVAPGLVDRMALKAMKTR